MKKLTFTQQLKAYSTLASSFLAMHGNAQIAYTNINPDKVLGGTIPNTFPLIDIYDLDLNNDGVYDYRFQLEVTGPDAYFNSYTYSRRISVQGLQSVNGMTNEVMLTYTGNSSAHVVVPLNGGINIESSETFAKNAFVSYVLHSAGAGIAFSEAYLALRFHLDNNTYMGWARVSKGKPTFPDTPALIIKDYAYNPVAGESILSGQRIENACSDPLEPLWFENGPTIQLNNSYSALISPEGDIDKLKFIVQSSAPNIRLVLSNLPKNYNLRLLNSSSAPIGSSHHGGVVNDTVVANNLAPGTYYAEVQGGKNKFQPDKCYSLIVESSATPYREAAETANENVTSEFQAYPNPANDLLIVRSTTVNAQTKLNIYDMMGRLVLTQGNSNSESDGSIKININSLSEGAYMLHIESEKIVGVTKFIIQR